LDPGKKGFVSITDSGSAYHYRGAWLVGNRTLNHLSGFGVNQAQLRHRAQMLYAEACLGTP